MGEHSAKRRTGEVVPASCSTRCKLHQSGVLPSSHARVVVLFTEILWVLQGLPGEGRIFHVGEEKEVKFSREPIYRPTAGRAYLRGTDARIVVFVTNSRIFWKKPKGEKTHSSTPLGWAQWVQASQRPKMKRRKRLPPINAVSFRKTLVRSDEPVPFDDHPF